MGVECSGHSYRDGTEMVQRKEMAVRQIGVAGLIDLSHNDV